MTLTQRMAGSRRVRHPGVGGGMDRLAGSPASPVEAPSKGHRRSAPARRGEARWRASRSRRSGRARERCDAATSGPRPALVPIARTVMPGRFLTAARTWLRRSPGFATALRREPVALRGFDRARLALPRRVEPFFDDCDAVRAELVACSAAAPPAGSSAFGPRRLAMRSSSTYSSTNGRSSFSWLATRDYRPRTSSRARGQTRR